MHATVHRPDAARGVDVWMVDLRLECDLHELQTLQIAVTYFRWLEWIVCWELDRQEEDAAFVR